MQLTDNCRCENRAIFCYVLSRNRRACLERSLSILVQLWNGSAPIDAIGLPGVHRRVGLSLLDRHGPDLLIRGQALEDFLNSVLPQRPHTFLLGLP